MINSKEQFEDLQLDFYRWMVDCGGIGSRSRSNYISWLTFLASFPYNIDLSITEEHLSYILKKEDENRLGRELYSRKEDINNFKSALRKFLRFVQKRIDERHKAYLRYHNDRCFF